MFKPPPLLLALALVALAVVVYLPSLSGGFIWDDNQYVIQHPMIHAGDGLWRFWFTREAADYWPVTYSSFWIEYRLWGNRPMGYRLVNLALHAGTVLLAWSVLARLRVPGAWWAAALFAVHPVNVESVAWIFQRKNLLSLLFTLMSLRLYLHIDETPAGERWRARRWSIYLAAVFCYALALLSKVAVVMTPVILLALAWWRRGRVTRRDVWLSAPWFALSAGLGALNMLVKDERSLGGMAPLEGGLWSRACSGATAVWFYLGKTIWPTHLAFVYPRWQVDAHAWRWWVAPAALVLLAAMLWWWRRRITRAPLTALVVFVLALLPALHVTHIAYFRYSLVADHYQHMAMLAPLALGTAGACLAWRGMRANPFTGRALAAAILLLSASLTWSQAAIYQSEQRVWRDSIAKNPRAFLAMTNLAGSLIDEGRLDEAQSLARQAIRVNPRFAEAHGTLGRALAAAGRYDEALASYQQGLAIEPRYAEIWFNVGNACLAQGRFSQAVHAFEQARRIHEGYVDAYINQSVALLKLNDLPAAGAVLREALRQAPGHVDANYRLALVLGMQGQTRQATEQLQRVVALAPDHAEARELLAQLRPSSP
jgi:tetratricopeptide (TPR) repeat protein